MVPSLTGHPNATVSEVVKAIREDGYADYCTVAPGVLAKPEELWLPSIGTWVRTDGTYYGGDRGRGPVWPWFWQRWRIRRAVKFFKSQEVFDEGDIDDSDSAE